MPHPRMWRVLVATVALVLTAMLATPRQLPSESVAAQVLPAPTPATVLEHGLGAIIPDPGANGE